MPRLKQQTSFLSSVCCLYFIATWNLSECFTSNLVSVSLSARHSDRGSDNRLPLKLAHESKFFQLRGNIRLSLHLLEFDFTSRPALLARGVATFSSLTQPPTRAADLSARNLPFGNRTMTPPIEVWSDARGAFSAPSFASSPAITKSDLAFLALCYVLAFLARLDTSVWTNLRLRWPVRLPAPVARATQAVVPVISRDKMMTPANEVDDPFAKNALLPDTSVTHVSGVERRPSDAGESTGSGNSGAASAGLSGAADWGRDRASMRSRTTHAAMAV